ncbi:LCP family protein [Candidatus Uhrbacteria bacterium]|jgi:polyisoprenyl-teichoic acid--peptidoglycan teichoic acid transferase|nr:LCP family protein [Candidatus Uhrbacteria bacterium]
MSDNRINLLEDHFELHPDPKPRPWMLGRYFFLSLSIIALLGVGFSFAMSKTEIASDSEGGGFFRTFASLVTSEDKLLQGEDNDRVNILLMGIGGAGHDGAQLTDTIIYGSYKPSTGDVGMMSIPRDLAIPIPGYGWRKINHTNYFGEVEETGGGAEYAAEVIGDLLNQDMHYYVKIDFQGFEDFIDNLGGIDVYVETAFTDPLYPTKDHLTQTISFEEGWQHMDGETVLQFSRSRHGTNGEGSDFARSRRQQKVLLGVKDKVFSAKTIFNPKRISNLIGTVKENIDTNLSTWELVRLSSFARDFEQENIHHYVLDNSIDSPLYETHMNGAYVLLPDNDDWSGIRSIAANIFEEDPSYDPINPSQTIEQYVKIRIENGTAINGLAFRTSQLLEGQGFEVASVANAATRDWDHTVIYDFSEGNHPDELKALQDYLKADVETTVTGWLFTDGITPRSIALEDEGLRDGTPDAVDFLVVLGQNSANLVRR